MYFTKEENNIYGYCECGTSLEPVWGTEEEYKSENGIMWKTGRKRIICDYLICPDCHRKYVVDDSFDGKWM